jgi:hypothetical protein
MPRVRDISFIQKLCDPELSLFGSQMLCLHAQCPIHFLRTSDHSDPQSKVCL